MFFVIRFLMFGNEIGLEGDGEGGGKGAGSKEEKLEKQQKIR